MAIQGGLQGSLEGRCIRIRGGVTLGTRYLCNLNLKASGFWRETRMLEMGLRGDESRSGRLDGPERGRNLVGR